MNELIKKIRQYAISEHKPAIMPLFEIAERKALELADKENADKDLTNIGVCLMDLKLWQAQKEGRLVDHVKMSVDASIELLKEFNLEENDFFKKIINCVEAHHGDIPFICKEAEICANADCYKFVHPKGFFNYLIILGKRYDNFQDCLIQAEKKLDEKYKILSLDICKKELEENYQLLKKLIAKARE